MLPPLLARSLRSLSLRLVDMMGYLPTTFSESLTEVYDPKAFFPHAASHVQAFAH